MLARYFTLFKNLNYIGGGGKSSRSQNPTQSSESNSLKINPHGPLKCPNLTNSWVVPIDLFDCIGLLG